MEMSITMKGIRDVIEARKVTTPSEVCQPHSQYGADRRQHDALRHQLTEYTVAARTERASDGNLLASGRRLGQQQTPNVGANDE